MAWEWVAPVSTAAVGLGGIVATYLTGHESRKSAAKQLENQLRSAADATLRADRLKAYSEFIVAFWDSMAKSHTAFLMGAGMLPASQEEKSTAVSEAQLAQGKFNAAMQAAAMLGGAEITRLLPAFEAFINQRFVGALGAVSEDKGNARLYHSPATFNLDGLYKAMKAELGVEVESSDLERLVERSDRIPG